MARCPIAGFQTMHGSAPLFHAATSGVFYRRRSGKGAQDFSWHHAARWPCLARPESVHLAVFCRI